MGFFSFIFPWGLVLQAMALVHFVRRRPDTFWLWIIVFLGPLGAAVYIALEVVPDLGLLRQSYDAFGRRKRIGALEAIVKENPAVGNFEELADLYLDNGEWANKILAKKPTMPRYLQRRERPWFRKANALLKTLG